MATREEGFIEKREMGTNLTLLALYLIMASHFAAPALLEGFGISLGSFTPSIWLPLKLISPSLTETSPWFMIFALIPHFLLGFDVETRLGSMRYAFAILGCGSTATLLTILISFLMKQAGIAIIDDTTLFASSVPLLLLCILCFTVFVPQPIGTFRNVGVILLLIVHVLTILRSFTEPILLLNLTVSWVVVLVAVRLIDGGATLDVVGKSLRFKDANWAVDATADPDLRQQALNGLAKEVEETKALL